MLRPRTLPRPPFGTIPALFLGLALTGCGGGGGSLVGSSTLQIEVIEESAYLTRPGLDVRTVYLTRFRLSDGADAPVEELTEANFMFVRDGNPATSENAGTPSGTLARVDVALCLDNSKSIAFDELGQATPMNVETLRDGAITFANEIAARADMLRIYRFSTSSRTEHIGTYQSDGTTWGTGSTGNTPETDIMLQIAPDPVLDNGTALYQCLNLAFADDADGDDLTVVLSDGVEEGSAPGSVDVALANIAENNLVVYSVGVGNVNPDELNTIATFGDVFLIDTFDGLQGVFEAIARRVRSFYTVIYDTPLQEGLHDIELRVTTDDGLTGSYTSQFAAGIELANGTYYHPLTPGSRFTFLEYSATVTERVWTVRPVSEAFVNPENGILHFALENDLQPGVAASFAAPYGQGAIRDLGALDPGIVHVPSQVTLGATWRSPDQPAGSLDYTVVAFETVDVQGTTYEECAVIEVRIPETGALFQTQWMARGVGTVRREAPDGSLLLELKEPPVVSTLFF